MFFLYCVLVLFAVAHADGASVLQECTNLNVAKADQQYQLYWDSPSLFTNNHFRVRCLKGCENYVSVQWDVHATQCSIPHKLLLKSAPGGDNEFALGVACVSEDGLEGPNASITIAIHKTKKTRSVSHFARDEPTSTSSSFTSGTTISESFTTTSNTTSSSNNTTTAGQLTSGGSPSTTSSSSNSSVSSTSGSFTSGSSTSPASSATSSASTDSSASTASSDSSTSSSSDSSTSSSSDSSTSTTDSTTSTSSATSATSTSAATSTAKASTSTTGTPTIQPYTTITIILTVTGDIDQFRRNSSEFIATLARALGVDRSRIIINITTRTRATTTFEVSAVVAYTSTETVPPQNQVSQALNSNTVNEFYRSNNFTVQVASVNIVTPSGATTTTTGNAQTARGGGSKTPTGVIVAAVLVPVVVVVAAIVGVFLFMRFRRKRWEQRGHELEQIYKPLY